MALLLSFDTATKHCAVALSEGDRLLAHRVEDSERFSHAEMLNVFIDEVMREAGVGLNDLDAVAVGVGPGSYTGLRIGLSAAKGLCFALDIPLIGLATLDVLAHELRASVGVPSETDVLHPMIDARRMEVFTRTMEGPGIHASAAKPLILEDAWCVSLLTDRVHLVFGDGADKATELWPKHAHIQHVPGIRPSARGLATAAAEAFQQKDFADLAYLVPDYGKDANVTAPKRVQ